MIDPDDIARRLRYFCDNNFSSKSDFSRALGISPQNLSKYLMGQRVPGNKFKNRLEKLGCDTIWLLTGMTHHNNKTSMSKPTSLYRRGHILAQMYAEVFDRIGSSSVIVKSNDHNTTVIHFVLGSEVYGVTRKLINRRNTYYVYHLLDNAIPLSRCEVKTLNADLFTAIAKGKF